jgi:hypothetical protein
MTELGQKRKWPGTGLMSVLPSTADIVRPLRHVRKVPILLQKSAAAGGWSAILLKANGFDPPALALFTQFQRYAMHRT